MFNWLTIELTNRCNKSCSFCGRAKARDKMDLGDMDLDLFKQIISQYEGDVIQFSKDGDPLLYPHLDEVAELCQDRITNIVTNGILLWGKAETVSKFTTICVSVTERDDKQFEDVWKFVKAYSNPVTIKFLGKYDDPRYEQIGLRTTRRTIHEPKGDWNYQGRKPVIPELGICLDFLNKPSISWDGYLSICNRYDPKREAIIGDCAKNSLNSIWNGNKRKEYLKHHLSGNRGAINFCSKCNFWGCPTGG